MADPSSSGPVFVRPLPTTPKDLQSPETLWRLLDGMVRRMGGAGLNDAIFFNEVQGAVNDASISELIDNAEAQGRRLAEIQATGATQSQQDIEDQVHALTGEVEGLRGSVNSIETALADFLEEIRKRVSLMSAALGSMLGNDPTADIETLYATKVNRSGDTMTGALTGATTSATVRPFNIPAGAADFAAPSQGDVWNNADALKYRTAGSTETLAFLSSSITGSAAKWTTARTLSYTGNVTGSGSVDGSADVAFALTIANQAVTYAKMQNVSATARFLGRVTAGAGSPEELTPANAWTVLGVTPAANFPALTGDVTTVAGALAATIAAKAVTYAKMQDISATSRFLGRITVGAGSTEELTAANAWTVLGVQPAANVPIFAGDVTTAGGSLTTSIANNAVTLAKMATMATASFLGRSTAGTGNVQVLSVASAQTLLGTSGTNTGDQTITLTGDVTGSGTGSFAATIGANTVTLAKMDTMATASLLGRNTAGVGNVEVLSASTARSLLGLVIGTNVQAWDADLDTLASTYATGTWTPTVSLTTAGTSSFAYTEQTGTYTRIGNIVFARCRLTFTPTIGTGSGNIRLGGLPVLPAFTFRSGGTIQYMQGFAAWPAGSTSVNLYVALAASSLLGIVSHGSGITSQDWAVAQLTGGGAHSLYFQMIYEV